MRRLSLALALTSSLLLGSVALAQQGLIREPWRPALPAPARATLPNASPASGLPAAELAPSSSPTTRVEAVTAPPKPPKWRPPVVELLVDPWARATQMPQAPAPHWQPDTTEIIDPWAEAALPRVPAAPPRATERSSIF